VQRLSTLCRFTGRHTCAGNQATGLQVAKGAVIEWAWQLLSTSEDDMHALNRVRTQSRLPIYFWRRRGVVHSAPTPAGVRGAKAGLSCAEIRSRLRLDLISAHHRPSLLG